jgi:flagellar basal-body rod protein FlgF
MENASYIALSRMIVQQKVLDSRATNIANMSTPGFKAETVVFSDYLVNQNNVKALPGERQEQMVQDRGTFRDFSQGDIAKTGNPLDFALEGSGFFVISTPQGDRYSRAGRFSLSPTGQVVDTSGRQVMSTTGRPIVIPSGDTQVQVTSDGTISSESGPLGKLRIVQFAAPENLQAEGGSLYSATDTPQPSPTTMVVQGATENANVQAVVQMTRMMAEMHDFEFASQFVDNETQRGQSAIDHILRPQS